MLDRFVGQTLDHYTITALLGSGGMGSVYKGHDIRLQRDVAIKIMHPHIASQPNFAERFLQEARTAAALDHPGIIQVYEFGSNNNLLYIVMKFIAGDNLEGMLRDLKKNGQWIDQREGVQVISQVAIALDYAHHKGVLHRDIKPGNIMIEPIPGGGFPYRPVITDLGLAKLAQGGVVTQDGTSMGTPAYMSPEQALGQETDARSDVYSLGILLFELAAGQLPFPARTLTEAVQYHTRQAPPAPSSINPNIPTGLEAAILKAIDKDPNKRYQSAAALAKALQAITIPPKQSAPSLAPSGAASLVTVYQQSVIEQRGESILVEFPVQPGLTRDRIQILGIDKSVRAVEVNPKGMTIGRDPDNDIVIDFDKVSRHHARVEFDGAQYRVTDLNSSNGTFLANARLLPGIPEVWPPDKMINISGNWLRLERAQGKGTVMQGATVAGGAPGATRLGATVMGGAARGAYTQRSTSLGDGRVGVFLQDTPLNVEPGQAVSIPVLLVNQGEIVDKFNLSLEGTPLNWVSIPQKSAQLLPGEQAEALITVQPPRNPQSRAGRYPLTVRVTSESAPEQGAVAKTNLTVAAFSEYNCDIYPQKLRDRQVGRLTVENHGNTPESFTLSFKDNAGEVEFNPPGAQLNVPEGRQVVAEFAAQPRKRDLIGREKTRQFSVRVAAGSKDAQVFSGELVSRPLIPAWIIPVMLTMCICLVGALAALYGWRSTQLAQASATSRTGTSVALALTQTQSAGMTQTALALLGANQATLQAATSTALWLGLDDDADGLTNQEEITLKTLPNNRDTDADGLSDYVEVKQKKTDPLNDDTDGDGLKDGFEVEHALNPLNVDTDGDGSNDAQDPAPGATSTATADLAATQGFIVSQTVSAQGTAQAIAASQTAEAGQLTQQAMDQAGQQTMSAQQTSDALQATQTYLDVFNSWLGDWKNVDPNTRGITHIIIEKIDDQTMSFHGFGSCHPTDCDWNTVPVAYDPITMVAVWDFGFVKTTVTVHMEGNQMVADVLDDFSDADGRPDAQYQYTFEK